MFIGQNRRRDRTTASAKDAAAPDLQRWVKGLLFYMIARHIRHLELTPGNKPSDAKKLASVDGDEWRQHFNGLLRCFKAMTDSLMPQTYSHATEGTFKISIPLGDPPVDTTFHFRITIHAEDSGATLTLLTS